MACHAIDGMDVCARAYADIAALWHAPVHGSYTASRIYVDLMKQSKSGKDLFCSGAYASVTAFLPGWPCGESCRDSLPISGAALHRRAKPRTARPSKKHGFHAWCLRNLLVLNRWPSVMLATDVTGVSPYQSTLRTHELSIVISADLRHCLLITFSRWVSAALLSRVSLLSRSGDMPDTS
jgi:hypothetical protein